MPATPIELPTLSEYVRRRRLLLWFYPVPFAEFARNRAETYLR